jgi:hypothetical protein
VRNAVLLLSGAAAITFYGSAIGYAGPDRHEPRPAGDVSEQDSKVRELSALPVGIRVTHTPNPAKAQAGGRSGQPYTWLYETRVTAISEDVSIIEFGALVRKSPQSGSWELRTIYGRPFNGAEFADWYSCREALVRKSASCADPSNYTGSSRLEAFETRWYFVGRTRTGKLVKGEEIVRASPDLQKTSPLR